MVPPELSRLLDAVDPAEREAAWQAFVERYSPLLLYTARAMGREYDAGMDAYTYLLEQLRDDAFRRLRSYVPRPHTKFETWLVVVARRLCLDHRRERYGRATTSAAGSETRAARRQLVDLIAEELDPSALTTDNPETQLRARQLSGSLTDAIASLDPRDRLLLRLRFTEGLRARDVARVMRYPTPFHVYQRLNTVLRRLRADLRRRGIESSEP